MQKQFKVLIVFGAVALALVAFLVSTSRVEKVGDEDSAAVRTSLLPSRPPVDPARLEEEYRSNMKATIAEAEEAIAEAEEAIAEAEGAGGRENAVTGADRLAELKVALLDLTVPEAYREAHLDFVIALSKVKTAIEQGDAGEKAAGLALFNSALDRNEWLKN